jgi:DNA-binding GntR family transcriptional regulator
MSRTVFRRGRHRPTRMQSKSSNLNKTGQIKAPSRLHGELAARILHLLKEQGAGVGHHLVELDLCEHFAVSRTPVRGALNLLASRGVVEARANRGFVLRKSPDNVPEPEPITDRDEDDTRLFVDIAQARMSGKLPDECSQQELVRQFDTKVAIVVRVLRQLAELGLVERKPGNGWSFLPSIDSTAAQRESYQFRMLLEPAILQLPDFKLDAEWARDARAHHEAFRARPWRTTLAVEFYEMNASFHESLALASGNRYMLSTMQQQNRLRRFLNYNWNYGVDRVYASIAEHLAILTALEAGDNEFAAALMRRHLGSAKDAYSERERREEGCATRPSSR